MSQPKPVEERFFEKVDAAGEDECWEWQAAINSSGYGNIQFRGSVRHAHRIAYCLSNDCLDRVDDIDVVRHSCDNRSCCNPHHLLSGDKQLNAQDMVERERTSGQKLNLSDVREIRERYENEDITQKELGEEYGCTKYNISYVVNEESFKFVK